MRRLSLFVLAAVLTTRAVTAQIVQAITPPPAVTAADAAWQLRGDPVSYGDSFYDRSGPTVFFDGNVMVRSGTYEGVPLYVDATSTITNIVLVPIGGNLMRPYKRREGPGPAVADAGPSKEPSAAAATLVPLVSPPPAVSGSSRAAVETIPGPSSNSGIWISYRGARWHSAGAAVSYSADRFVRVGQYRGLPVYRDKRGPADEVYLPAVKDGPLAPYRRN